jgi:DNA repair exonuclease SbcCD ATPase subunit
LEAARSELTDTKSELEQSQGEVTSLREQVAEKDGEISQRQAEIEKLNAEQADLQRKCTQLTEENKNLGERLAKKERELAELREEKDGLGAQLAQKEEQVKELSSRVSALEDRVRQLEAVLEESNRITQATLALVRESGIALATVPVVAQGQTLLRQQEFLRANVEALIAEQARMEAEVTRLRAANLSRMQEMAHCKIEDARKSIDKKANEMDEQIRRALRFDLKAKDQLISQVNTAANKAKQNIGLLSGKISAGDFTELDTSVDAAKNDGISEIERIQGSITETIEQKREKINSFFEKLGLNAALGNDLGSRIINLLFSISSK